MSLRSSQLAAATAQVRNCGEMLQCNPPALLMGPRAALALPAPCFFTVSTAAPAGGTAGAWWARKSSHGAESVGSAIAEHDRAHPQQCCDPADSHAARLQAAPAKTAGNGALCPPARMAALTAEGFLAAALVGAFLRMTTWSQS